MKMYVLKQGQFRLRTKRYVEIQISSSRVVLCHGHNVCHLRYIIVFQGLNLGMPLSDNYVAHQGGFCITWCTAPRGSAIL